MKTLLKYLALAATIAGATQVVQAVPQLKIFDGINTIIITDNGGGDGSSALGRIVFDGTIGNWTLNTHVGTTFPAIGTLSNPQMDLSFNATSNGAGGTLTISFSADGFGPTNGTALAQIGGTAQGTVGYQTFGGTNNTLFDTSHQLTTQGPFGPGAFSGTVAGGAVANVGPYSLTQQVTITHTGAAITTGDAFLTVPDSGTSILLLGAGLTGLAMLARARRFFA
jgi:hypothetical protein